MTLHDAIILAATEPNTWTNAALAEDLDVPAHKLGKVRAKMARPPAAKLEPGDNRRPGLRLTDLGRAYARLQGWRIDG